MDKGSYGESMHASSPLPFAALVFIGETPLSRYESWPSVQPPNQPF